MNARFDPELLEILASHFVLTGFGADKAGAAAAVRLPAARIVAMNAVPVADRDTITHLPPAARIAVKAWISR